MHRITIYERRRIGPILRTIADTKIISKYSKIITYLNLNRRCRRLRSKVVFVNNHYIFLFFFTKKYHTHCIKTRYKITGSILFELIATKCRLFPLFPLSSLLNNIKMSTYKDIIQYDSMLFYLFFAKKLMICYYRVG